jgi:hypothetical protein
MLEDNKYGISGIDAIFSETDILSACEMKYQVEIIGVVS